MGFISKEIRGKLKHIFGEDVSSNNNQGEGPIEKDADEKKDEKDSFYFWVGTTKVRVSNHKTHLKTWVNDLKINSKKRPIKRISLVFEDEPTVGSNELKEPYKKKLSVYEWTYELWNEEVGINVNGKGIKAIAKAISNIATQGTYIDPYNTVNPVEVKYEPKAINQNNITTQQPKNNNHVTEGLYHQYEMMYKLGCIPQNLFESMICN